METKGRFGTLAAVCVVVLGLSAVAWSEDPVYFADPNLKRHVETRLWIKDPTPTDILGLTELWLGGMHITDLTGLEYATNLQILSLRVNRITDVFPLAGCINLQTLQLSENEIRDLTPLAGLTNLVELDLHHNRVSDLSPLAGLTNLQSLILYNNQVSDLSPLLGLTRLRTLELRENPLNEQAYTSYLQMIDDNNPRLGWPLYSPNRTPPAGVTASKGLFTDRVRITWEPVDNGLSLMDSSIHYQVSRALSEDGSAEPISEWQTSLSFDDLTAEPGTKYVYWVRTAGSSQGASAGDVGEPDVGWTPGPSSLEISAGPGGTVTIPGIGLHETQVGQIIQVHAEPVDANLYCFAGWTGTAVSTGLVADANAAATSVPVDAARSTLRANFLSRLSTIYVDDDAAHDPGPCTTTVSDSQENGTFEHPFDTIQEAIDVASEGATVVARAGTYHECIELLGRNITVTGFEPNEPRVAKSLPVIDANYAGTAVTFRRGEDPNCVLTGFVITRGKGDTAGALYCRASSPMISNCLIVGNQATDASSGAVYCTSSEAVFANCTIADNVAGVQGTGVYMSYCNIAFVNSIIWGNTPRNTFANGRLDGGSRPWMTYTDMTDHPYNTDNIESDPLFVRSGGWADPNDPDTTVEPGAAGAIWIAGDYHLKSQAGRWDPASGGWVLDEVTSPRIDAGDPNTPVGDEPEPNGGRINMGVYGGTGEASLSYSGQ